MRALLVAALLAVPALALLPTAAAGPEEDPYCDPGEVRVQGCQVCDEYTSHNGGDPYCSDPGRYCEVQAILCVDLLHEGPALLERLVGQPPQ